VCKVFADSDLPLGEGAVSPDPVRFIGRGVMRMPLCRLWDVLELLEKRRLPSGQSGLLRRAGARKLRPGTCIAGLNRGHAHECQGKCHEKWDQGNGRGLRDRALSRGNKTSILYLRPLFCQIPSSCLAFHTDAIFYLNRLDFLFYQRESPVAALCRTSYRELDRKAIWGQIFPTTH
jgi:hypothetical protein